MKLTLGDHSGNCQGMSPVSPRRSKSLLGLERQYTYAHTRKLLAEARQIELSNETSKYKGNDRFGLFTRNAAVGTFVLALAALGTLILDLVVDYRDQTDRRIRFEENILTDLTSNEAHLRAISAVSLEEIMARSDKSHLLLPPLIDAAVKERVPFVKSTQLSVLASYADRATTLLLEIRQYQDALAVTSLSHRGNVLQKLDNQKEQNAHSGDIDSTRILISEIETSLRQAQYEAIHASDLFRKLMCSPNKQCPIDLSGLHLRDYPFYSSQFDYESAIFRNAFLNSADFYGTVLRYAIFDGAQLSGADFGGASLEGATFVKAEIPLPPGNLSESELRRCIHNNGAKFPEDLAGVSFQDANLSGANFLDSNLTLEQLELSGSWDGAALPQSIADELEYTNPARPESSIGDAGQRRQCKRSD